MSEYDIAYLLVDGIAERIQFGRPRESALPDLDLTPGGNFLDGSRYSQPVSSIWRVLFSGFRRTMSRGRPPHLGGEIEGAVGVLSPSFKLLSDEVSAGRIGDDSCVPSSPLSFIPGRYYKRNQVSFRLIYVFSCAHDDSVDSSRLLVAMPDSEGQ